MEPQWYCYFDRTQDGPLAQVALTRRFGERLVPLYALVWSSAWKDQQWRPARDVPPFLRAALAPPLPVPRAMPAAHPAPPRRPAAGPAVPGRPSLRPLAGTAGGSIRRPAITLARPLGRPRTIFAPRPATWPVPPAAQPPLTAFVIAAVVMVVWAFSSFVGSGSTAPVIHQPPGWISSSTPSGFPTPAIINSEQIRALLAEGRAEMLAAHWRRAIAAYEGVLTLDAASPEALSQLGLAYDFDGKPDHARADWSSVVAVPPVLDRDLCYRALAFIGLDQPGKALPALRGAAEVSGYDTWDYCLRGQARYWLQEYPLALGEFDAAVLLDPQAAFVFYLRANAHRQLRQSDLAIQDYDAALRLNPRYEQAFYQRGRIYLERAQYEHAFGDFSEALRLNPRNAAAHVGCGDAFRGQLQNNRAVTEYSLALQIQPTLRAAYIGRAAAYRALGMSAEARKDEDRANASSAR